MKRYEPDRDERGLASLTFAAGCIITMIITMLEGQQTELAILAGALIGFGMGLEIHRA